MKTSETTFGADDPRLVKSLVLLATIYTDSKEWDKANAVRLRVISIYDKEVESSSLNASLSRNQLADTYFRQGKVEGAEKPFQDAIKSYSKSMGANSILVASLLDSLADVHFRKKKYTECENDLTQSLSIKEKVLGPKNEYLIVTLEKYADLLKVTGNSEKAQAMRNRAESIQKSYPISERAGLGE